MNEVTETIAVAAKEAKEFGCPYCGYRSGYSFFSGDGTSVILCGECNRPYAILADGVTRSSISFGGSYLELTAHPRQGIPTHGTPDTKPDGGGEYFRSRGIGVDTTPGCFVCGGGNGSYHNIAAFVHGRDAGERVVAMFYRGARLDYRRYEPDYVQVKIGACHRHLANLERLDALTRENKDVITTYLIRVAAYD